MDLSSILLITVLLIPLIVGIFTLLLQPHVKITKWVQVLLAIINLIILIIIYNHAQFNISNSVKIEIAHLSNAIYFGFMIEKFSLLFALMVNILWIFTLIYSIEYLRLNRDHSQGRFFGFFALAITATLGIAFSSNLITIFLFYELLTLSTYPLVAHKLKEHPEYQSNAMKYLFILLITSLMFFLPAIALTLIYLGSTDFTSGGLFITRKNTNLWLVLLILVLYIFGVAKAATMPMHKWLPSAMIAPSPISGLLHGVAVVKSGIFILFKIIVFIFGSSYLKALITYIGSYNFLLIIPSVTIILASLIAMTQTNLKKLLAYSTISQLSYIILAFLLFNNNALLGGILHISAHAVAKLSMFLVAGMIITLTGCSTIDEMKGLGYKMPIATLAFTVSSLSIIGFPLTAGFLSKWFIIKGIYDAQQYWVIFVIIISTVLNAMYLIPPIYKMWLEPLNKANQALTIKPAYLMNFVVASISSLVIIMYIYNEELIDLILN